MLYFPAPKTVTGEDVLELHVHGGPAVVRAVLAAIPQCGSNPGLKSSAVRTSQIRYAEPGEFTRRAFANNRMDLPQIESLGETLSASTEQQRKLSVRGTTASLAARYEYWRMLLLAARGELEALIDFSEDQHFDESPAQLCASIADQVKTLRVQMEAHVENAVRGELLRNGISVALLGAPNAGKSSLLNRIVGREAAIVSEEAGTTRDVVEVGIDLKGWLVKIGDMAGLRKTGLVGPDIVGAIEEEGIKRAKQRALASDVAIVVQDATAEMNPEVMETAMRCIERGVQVLVAVNKTDKIDTLPEMQKSWTARITSTLSIPSSRISFISCAETAPSTPGTIQPFLSALITTFNEMTSALIPDSAPDPSLWQESLGATERQRLLLSDCLSHLDDFLASVQAPQINNATSHTDHDGADEVDIVIAAESLRSAADALSRITGRGESGDVEEVLGVVFEKYVIFSFCFFSLHLHPTVYKYIHTHMRDARTHCIGILRILPFPRTFVRALRSAAFQFQHNVVPLPLPCLVWWVAKTKILGPRLSHSPIHVPALSRIVRTFAPIPSIHPLHSQPSNDPSRVRM